MARRPNSDKHPKGKRFNREERRAAIGKLRKRLDLTIHAFSGEFGVSSRSMYCWAKEEGYDHETAREAAVARAIQEGRTISEIAKTLNVGVIRVKERKKLLEQDDVDELRWRIRVLEREVMRLRNLSHSLLTNKHGPDLVEAFLAFLQAEEDRPNSKPLGSLADMSPNS